MSLANQYRKANVKAWFNTIPEWVRMGLPYLFEQTFTIPVIGDLTDETVYGGVKFPYDVKVTAIAAHVQTAPTGAAVNVCVAAGGSEIAQVVTGLIAATETDGYYRFGENGEVPTQEVRIPAGTAVAIKVKQVGSSVAGADGHFSVTVQPWTK